MIARANPRSLVCAAVVATLTGGLTACGGVQLGTRGPAPAPPRRESPAASVMPQVDPVAYHRERGLMADGAPFPFTGIVRFVAAGPADSTHAIVALALSADALTFRREGEGFRADYRVSIQLRRGSETFAGADAAETVRVATLRETSRAEEVVLFQQFLTVPPGSYALSLELRDVASGRVSSQTVPVTVPSFAARSLAPPIAVFEWINRASRAAMPRLIANPTATAVAGRDSVLPIYVEAYALAPAQAVSVSLRVEGQEIWTGAATPTAGTDLATALIDVPIGAVGIGSADVLVWADGARDTVRTPVFVGFASDRPTTSYADMLGYLEYFTSERRLSALRALPPRERGEAWRALMRATDPDPGSPENEALTRYFLRMRQASALYAEGGVEGWRTDRGRVLLILGEPDRVLDQFAGDATIRSRLQQWEYRSPNLTIMFEDATGLNRWRLTRESEAALAAERERRHGGN